MRVDVHQHIWTQPLLEALAARDSLPYVRRDDGLTVLHSAGERPYVIDVDAEAPRHRLDLLRADGLDLALIALSSPIGIEALPRKAALELIGAHLDGAGTLGNAFAAWGPVPLDRPHPDDVDELLRRGCVGISLPAGALSAVEVPPAIDSLLERIEARGAPLFVHPGPAPARNLPEASLGEMLAGGAPLVSERLIARGGPRIDLRDPRIFYDTSSYGPAAIAPIRALVGSGQVVYGSDRPVVEQTPGAADGELLANGTQLVRPMAAAA
jgi:hypothetical protein